MNVELRHLRCMLAAADHGSFRRAAAALGVRESSISRRVCDLEKALGCRLFTRHSGGVRLTREGQCFARCARSAINRITEGQRIVAAMRQTGLTSLRIGIASSASAEALRCIDLAIRRHPGITLNTIQAPADDLLAGLQSRQIDMALLLGNVDRPDLVSTHLCETPIYAILSQTHLLARQSAVSWRDLVGETILVAGGDEDLSDAVDIRIAATLAECDIQPRLDRCSLEQGSMLDPIAMGCGICLTVDSSVAPPTLPVVVLPVDGSSLPINAVWKSRGVESNLGALIEEVLETAIANSAAKPS